MREERRVVGGADEDEIAAELRDLVEFAPCIRVGRYRGRRRLAAVARKFRQRCQCLGRRPIAVEQAAASDRPDALGTNKAQALDVVIGGHEVAPGAGTGTISRGK